MELILTIVAIAVTGIALLVQERRKGPEDPLVHDLGFVQMQGQMTRFYHDNRMCRKTARASFSKTYEILGESVAFEARHVDGQYFVEITPPEMKARIVPHLEQYKSRFIFVKPPASP